MYGGHGSIKNVLANNKNLLRKKSFFKSKKGISDKKQELLKGEKGELEFVEVSEGRLLDIKAKIQDEANKRNKKFLIVSLLIITILSAFIWFSFAKAYKREKHIEKLMDERGNIKAHQERLELYNMYLEEGQIQIENSHWKNATYFYKKALESFPNDSLALSKLNEIEMIKSSQLK